MPNHRNRKDMTCQQCGKILSLPASTSARRMYCSKQCWATHTKEMNMFTCEFCGARFHRARAAVARTKHTFCGAPCSRAYALNHRVLPDPLRRQGWRGPSWKIQSAWARVRDGNHCVRCGAGPENPAYKMAVHHIKWFYSFPTPDEANALSNLETLCRSCHSKEHRSEHFADGWRMPTPTKREPRPSHKPPIHSGLCEWCGKETPVYSKWKDRHKRFCTPSCQTSYVNVHRTKARTGDLK